MPDSPAPPGPNPSDIPPLPAETLDPAPANENPVGSSAWLRWDRNITRTGIGLYLLTAIGVIVYARAIGASTHDSYALIRNTIFFLIAGTIVWTLDLIRKRFKEARAIVVIIQVTAAVWIIFIPLLFLMWIGAFILRDVGILSPLRTEPYSYLLRPSGKAFSAGLDYDYRSSLRRLDNRATSFHVVQDPSHTGRLEGIYVEFGPSEDEIDAELLLPYEEKHAPRRIRLNRVNKTFDFID